MCIGIAPFTNAKVTTLQIACRQKTPIILLKYVRADLASEAFATVFYKEFSVGFSDHTKICRSEELAKSSKQCRVKLQQTDSLSNQRNRAGNAHNDSIGNHVVPGLACARPTSPEKSQAQDDRRENGSQTTHQRYAKINRAPIRPNHLKTADDSPNRGSLPCPHCYVISEPEEQEELVCEKKKPYQQNKI